MYTDLESSPPQYKALCAILANLDFASSEAQIPVKAEIQSMLDHFTDADWTLFSRMAKAEGVSPLMHYALTHSIFLAPEAVCLQMRQSYYESAAFNQMIFNEMERVVQALNDADIPVIVLKGAALATTIYPDPALRPMSDLDLLVKPDDLERAKELIFSLGYHEPIPEMAKGINRLTGHEYRLYKINNPAIVIELHWSIISGENDIRKPSIEWFWNNLIQVKNKPGNNNYFWIFLPESTIIYLIGHLIVQHGKASSKLVWLFDIFQIILINKNHLIWNSLVREISNLGWHSALLYSFNLIKDHFKYDFHNYTLTIDIDKNNQDQNNNFRSIWDGNQNIQNIYINRFVSIKGWEKYYLLLANIFPNEAYLRYRYNYKSKWQAIYYYPYRWWVIIWNGFRTFATKLFG